MKKRLLAPLLGLLFFLGVSWLSPTPIFSAGDCPEVFTSGKDVTLLPYTPGAFHEITVDLSTFDPGGKYRLIVYSARTLSGAGPTVGDKEAATNYFGLGGTTRGSNGEGSWEITGSTIKWKIKQKEALTSANISSQNEDKHYLAILRQRGGLFVHNLVCWAGSYSTTKNSLKGCNTIQISQSRGGKQCYYGSPDDCISAGSSVAIKVTGLDDGNGPYNGAVDFVYKGASNRPNDQQTSRGGVAQSSLYLPNSITGIYHIQLTQVRFGGNIPFPGCNADLDVKDYCEPASCNTDATTVLNVKVNGSSTYEICKQIDPSLTDSSGNNLYERCLECTSRDAQGRDGIWTAIGCIRKAPTEIVQTLIKLGLGMGGGVALLMLLVSAFLFSTSQGDPKRTGEAKDLVVAAITGLLFVIFSVTLLQIIGYSIFRIPGFGG